MKNFLLLFLMAVSGSLFTASAAPNVAVFFTDPSLQINPITPKKDVNVKAFMQEVALVYQTNRRKTAHIATATFEEYGKVNGRYAQYTISSGHAIYKGDEANVAKMALYSFVPEKTNKSWRRAEWLSNSNYNKKKRTDLPMNGGVGLNSYQYLELVGPLSRQSEKYNYQLKSVYWIGDVKVYRIRFNTKPAFSLTGRFAKGYIAVAADTKELISIDVSGELLWSSMFHERVFGTMHYEYDYYNEQPFISSISTRYEKKNIEERTLLLINLQKFNDFVVEQQSALDIQLLERNPVIIADKNLIKKASMGVDFDELKKDLGFNEILWEQYQDSSGETFWKYTDTTKDLPSENRENATELVQEYKKFFASF